MSCIDAAIIKALVEHIGLDPNGVVSRDEVEPIPLEWERTAEGYWQFNIPENVVLPNVSIIMDKLKGKYILVAANFMNGRPQAYYLLKPSRGYVFTLTNGYYVLNDTEAYSIDSGDEAVVYAPNTFADLLQVFENMGVFLFNTDERLRLVQSFVESQHS